MRAICRDFGFYVMFYAVLSRVFAALRCVIPFLTRANVSERDLILAVRLWRILGSC